MPDSEMMDLTKRLDEIVHSDDHARLCQGREYSCSCGYDERKDALIWEAANELGRLRALVEQAFRDGLVYGGNIRGADADLAWKHSMARFNLSEALSPSLKEQEEGN